MFSILTAHARVFAIAAAVVAVVGWFASMQKAAYSAGANKVEAAHAIAVAKRKTEVAEAQGRVAEKARLAEDEAGRQYDEAVKALEGKHRREIHAERRRHAEALSEALEGKQEPAQCGCEWSSPLPLK